MTLKNISACMNRLAMRFRKWVSEQWRTKPKPDPTLVVVPLGYEMKNWNPSIAVLCHLFYTPMLEEILGFLNNIPFAFDLFITTDTQEKKEQIERALGSWSKGLSEVRCAPNRGRDIAPKLITCRDVHFRYEFVLHLHSKKSPHMPVANEWRLHLLQHLLGSEEIIRSIFELFKSDPQLGMVAADNYTPIKEYLSWGLNNRLGKQFFSTRLKWSFPKQIDFPTGSMFWARSAALKPIFDADLALDEFENEKGQLDGTLAHVLERCYFLSCEKAHYKWVKITTASERKANHRYFEFRGQSEVRYFFKQRPLYLISSEKGKSVWG
jgi:lipopolysaccharide biosynthesis protein